VHPDSVEKCPTIRMENQRSISHYKDYLKLPLYKPFNLRELYSRQTKASNNKETKFADQIDVKAIKLLPMYTLTFSVCAWITLLWHRSRAFTSFMCIVFQKRLRCSHLHPHSHFRWEANNANPFNQNPRQSRLSQLAKFEPKSGAKYAISGV
jgi:hypothetical protein